MSRERGAGLTDFPGDEVPVPHREELIIVPEATPTAGTCIVTLRSEGEALPKSRQAHLVVGFSFSHNEDN
ncbi:MAG: hypothetical protein HY695_28940 [Deltaproteobacteria bacterium]|nr:hypothetical protein [Deltaproteobacteria bacterium]